MGAGAVSGHGRDTAGGTQNPSEKLTSNQQPNNGCSESQPNHCNNHLPPGDQPKPKSTAQMKMSCDRCSVNFSLFKRKKCCQECHRFFCSSCLPKPQSSSTVGRQCSKCRQLVSGRFSRDDLRTWKINDMRCFLNVRNISTKDCREKHDLIELVIARFCTHHGESLQDQVEHETLVQQMTAHVRDVSFINESSSPGTSLENSPLSHRNSQTGPVPHLQPETPAETQTTAPANQPFPTSHFPELNSSDSPVVNSTVESSTSANNAQGLQPEIQMEFNRDTLRELIESMERIQAIITQQDEIEQSAPPEQPVRRTQLNDITVISDIDELSIRQLKELLVNNFVDYKGCCEKAELVEKTKRLWKDHQDNILRAERIHKQEETAYNTNTDSEEAVLAEKLKEEPTSLSATASTSKAAEEEQDQDASASKPSAEEASITSVEAPEPAATSSGSKEINDSLCHICMDSLVDCILLECGHMVTCTQCGKRLAACPICRQYIVRVVRVFRS
jgi:hypothetical protein